MSLKKTDDKQITLSADSEKDFPIAIKAYRIRFRKDQLKKLELVTDNRNFFK